jgi:predicted ATPase
VLREHLGLLESDAEDDVRARLRDREILGLTLGLEAPGELHPLVVRDRLEEAWVELVEEMATERPLVVLVEDLHWSRQPLLDLLERLHRDARAAVLLIATARPEFVDGRAGWGTRPGSSVLWLEPLKSEDTALLVDALLGAEPPGEIRRLVDERAEGNPFFVEELLGTLIDRGILQRQNGVWRVLDLLASFDAPDSIRGLVAARVDLLGPAEKDALQAAAAIGRIFWPSALYAIAPRVSPDLRQLEDRGFVRRRAQSSLAGEREYEFKHALTREVAYASVPKKRRARLHAGFAEWVEQNGRAGDETSSLLAHHYAEAVRPEEADLAWSDDRERHDQLRQRAGEWLRRAAALAVGRYAIDDALAFLHVAVQLEPDVHAQIELWKQIAYTHELRYDGPPFREALQTALGMCEEDPAEQADIYSLLALRAAAKAAMWAYSPATRELVEDWIGRAVALSAPGSRAHVRALAARAMRTPGAIDEAVAAAEELADPELTSFALRPRIGQSITQMRYDDAVRSTEQRISLIDRINDPDHRAEIYDYGTYAELGRGNFDEARRFCDLHDTAVSGVSAHHDVHCVGLRFMVETVAGNWEHIRERERDAVAAVLANHDTPCTFDVWLLFECAAARAVFGDDERAAELEAEAEIRSKGHPAYADPRLLVALSRKDFAKIDSLLGDGPAEEGGWAFVGRPARLEALTLIGDRARVEDEAPPLASSGTIFAPFALRALGVLRGDDGLVQEAADRFRALGLDWHAEQNWPSGVTSSIQLGPQRRGA